MNAKNLKLNKLGLTALIAMLFICALILLVPSPTTKVAMATGNTITFDFDSTAFSVSYNTDGGASYTALASPYTVATTDSNAVYFTLTTNETPFVASGGKKINAENGVYSVTNISADTTITIDKSIAFDLSLGGVTVDLTNGYSGVNASGTAITGAHNARNEYFVMQSDAATATEYTISFTGNDLTANLTLNGINSTGANSVSIPAENDNTKYITLLLSGTNTIRNLLYYTHVDKALTGFSDSTLTIDNADDENPGSLTTTGTATNTWGASIGGSDAMSPVTGLTIAGGNITSFGKSSAAIGGGGNGYTDILITGGNVTATSYGTGATIGGGGGETASGVPGIITITGGTVTATNTGTGVAIGGASSINNTGGTGTVNISGGTVVANTIGGGTGTTGCQSATITITGGSVNGALTTSPTNGTSNVYLTRATIFSENEHVTNQAITSLTASNTNYGMNGVKTNDLGVIYFWIPSNSVISAVSDGTNEYTGSIACRDSGTLSHNCTISFCRVMVSVGNRYSLYKDADCTIDFEGSEMVRYTEYCEFYLQANSYASDSYYTVTAYVSAGAGMETLSPESGPVNGLYYYRVQATANTEITFVTAQGAYAPQAVMDIYGADVIIENDPDNVDKLKITRAGHTINNYSGTFLFSSDGLPSAHIVTIKSGTVDIDIDRLVAECSSSVINIEGGTVNIAFSNFDNKLISTGAPAINVLSGATLNIVSSTANNSLKLAGGTNSSAIGGSGNINITHTQGFLTLTPASGKSQITAGSFVFTTSSLTTATIPYSLSLSSGTLLGYSSSADNQLYATNHAHTVEISTTFTSCGVSTSLNGLTAAPSVVGNAVQIALTATSGNALPTAIGSISATRNGVALTTSDYSYSSGIVTLSPANSYGNIAVTAAANGLIAYSASSYSGAYDAVSHSISLSVSLPSSGYTIYYSSTTQLTSGNYDTGSTTSPTYTDNTGGNITIYWYIVAGGYVSASGSNTINITAGTNIWTSQLICEYIVLGEELSPMAVAKWGTVVYKYCDTIGGDYSTDVPTVGGTYFIRAEVAAGANNNYAAITSDVNMIVINAPKLYTSSGRVLSRITTNSFDNNATVAAAANDGFSILFNFYYTPSNSADLAIKFSSALPQNTCLTLIDFGGTIPVYYYYSVGSSTNTTSINLTSFIRMGTSSTLFAEEEDGILAAVAYQVCIDLPLANSSTTALNPKFYLGDAAISNTDVSTTFKSASVGFSNTQALSTHKTTTTINVTSAEPEKKVLAISLLDSNNNNVIELPATVRFTLDSVQPVLYASHYVLFDLGTGALSSKAYVLAIEAAVGSAFSVNAEIYLQAFLPSIGALATGKSSSVTPASYTFSVTETDTLGPVVASSTSTQTLAFNLAYTASDSPTFEATTYIKNGNSYSPLGTQWDISISGADSPRTATVTLPANVSAGTYRITFEMTVGAYSYSVNVPIIITS